MGGTPTTPRALTRSRSAAPADAVPFLPTARSRARRGGLRRPAHGRHPTHRRSRPRAALDLEGPARRGVGSFYGWGGGRALGGADRLAELGFALWAKTGRRPPVRRNVSASGPWAL